MDGVKTKEIKKGAANDGIFVHKFPSGFKVLEKRTSSKHEIMVVKKISKIAPNEKYIPNIFNIEVTEGGKSAHLYMEYVVGEDLISSLTDESRCESLANAVHQFNSLKPFKSKTTVDAMVESYGTKFRAQLDVIGDTEFTEAVLSECVKAEAYLIEHSELVFSHNDLTPENTLYNNEKNDFCFIDLGMANYNFKGADLHHILYFALSGKIPLKFFHHIAFAYAKLNFSESKTIRIACYYYALKRAVWRTLKQYKLGNTTRFEKEKEIVLKITQLIRESI